MTLERKRPPSLILAHNADDEKEPLTQSPMTAEVETPVVDAAADSKEEKFYTHLCDGCGVVFDCAGDANGNHAPELCRCEQEVSRHPVVHLIYFCSYECTRDT